MPVVFPNTYREGCVAGAMSFVGKWDPVRKDYSWRISNRIFLPRKVSTRGLVELDLSELKDGRLLLIMRGSNAGLDSLECPGRKWISVSSDGGLTWGEITDLRFDTGEQFYSPATFADHPVNSHREAVLFFEYQYNSPGGQRSEISPAGSRN